MVIVWSQGNGSGDSIENESSKTTNASLSDLVVDCILNCPICQQLLFALVTLNCSHNFCQHCIGEWREKQEHGSYR